MLNYRNLKLFQKFGLEFIKTIGSGSTFINRISQIFLLCKEHSGCWFETIFDDFLIDLIHFLLSVFLCHILFLSDFFLSRCKKIYLVKSFLLAPIHDTFLKSVHEFICGTMLVSGSFFMWFIHIWLPFHCSFPHTVYDDVGMDFPDLTVDGSFPLGAALSAVLITKGVNPILTLLVTFAAGAFAGMLTGIIHVKLKVRDLLSGIIMMTALYTVNLRIAGRANLPIYNMTTLFDNDFVRNVFKGGLAQFSNVIIILVITLVMKFLLDWYMSTKSGYLLRAVGDNETIVTSMGVDKGITKIIGLAIANGLCSLSGCIFAQQQRYFDVSMGTGTMVIGLASVIIGISLLKKATFLRVTSSVVIGAIVYKACVAIAIKLGMPSSDLKLITAVLFLIILVLGMDRNKRKKVA